jgi:uncharacterized protein YqgC (DUF456 family)
MELYTILGYALCILGIIGCIVPMLPGPWLAYAGILLPMLWDINIPAWQIWVGFALCIIVTILDYIVPAIGTAKFNGTKYGVLGCTIGTFLGLFFLPAGIVLGPFIGAVLGELIYFNRHPQTTLSETEQNKNSNFNRALRAGFGSFIGLLTGTLIKVICCGVMIAYFVKELI